MLHDVDTLDTPTSDDRVSFFFFDFPQPVTKAVLSRSAVVVQHIPSVARQYRLPNVLSTVRSSRQNRFRLFF